MSIQTKFTLSGLVIGVIPLTIMSTVVYFSLPEGVDKIIFRDSLLILNFIMALLVTVSSILSSQFITSPLNQLTEGIQIISKGDLSHRLNIMTSDEIGQVASSFDNMAGRLRSVYIDLEKKVDQRTKQLQEKAQELEKINKFLVGRELRMSELKSELDKFKKE